MKKALDIFESLPGAKHMRQCVADASLVLYTRFCKTTMDVSDLRRELSGKPHGSKSLNLHPDWTVLNAQLPPFRPKKD